MKRWLSEAWYNDSFLVKLLLPLSWLFGAVAVRKRQQALHNQWQAGVPVIVVGNITAGGTGKTPVCVALAQHFIAQGKRVVVISRGYGGYSTQYPVVVTTGSDPAKVGDEPVLMARQSACAVVVDPVRVRAAKLAVAQLQAEIIISDDGLQHYALARTIEIAVIDGARGLGNQLLLPAGPLREPTARLQTVDYVIVNGPLQRPFAAPIKQQVALQLQPGNLVNLVNGEQLSPAQWLQRHGATRTVHAVAGIGNPARFFASLQQLGFVIMPHAFDDHHAYQPTDLTFAADAAVVMTMKDAVKCQRFASPHWWALDVAAVLPADFLMDLENRIAC
ncbi:MAG: tetraacyldisaccharide 4'-kinase [Pseudomonadota bacterium]